MSHFMQAALALWWVAGLQYYIKFADRGPIHQIDKGEKVSLRRTAALIVCLPWIAVLHASVFAVELARGFWGTAKSFAESVKCTFYGEEPTP